MMNHKGTILLETERLILRRFKIEDAEDMFNNWSSDAEVTKYLRWCPHVNIDATKNRVNCWVNDYENIENYNWAIVPKNYGKVIGSITVINLSNEKQGCEIGYCMSKKFWNKGIMTESLKKVINYLMFEIGFKRICALHHAENLASGRVMAKSGMKYEGRLRKYNLNNKNELIDCDIYSILEEDIRTDKNLCK